MNGRLRHYGRTPVQPVQPARRGFILLLSLVMLAVAGVMMAAAVRVSSQSAMNSILAERRLQGRWAAISVERFCLPRAESILRVLGSASHPWRAELELDLSGQSYRVIVSDEQAKVNVNALWVKGGRLEVQKGLRKLQGQSREFLRLDMQPLPVATSQPAKKPRREIKPASQPSEEPQAASQPTSRPSAAPPPMVFYSFDQLLENATPQNLTGKNGRGLADQITLWNNGRVNVRRASIEVLRMVLGEWLSDSELASIRAALKNDPDAKLADVVQSLKVSEDELSAASELMTETSVCHSVWILPADGVGGRLSVETRGTGQTSGGLFAW